MRIHQVSLMPKIGPRLELAICAAVLLAWNKEAFGGSGPAPAAEPWVSAASAVVMDVQTGDILYQKNAKRIQPIASITKLMSALVFLDSNPDLNRQVLISTETRKLPGRKRFRPGERIRLYDLLCAALIPSDNVAAKMLALSSGSEQAFVRRMNISARSMGLSKTRFADPTGLNPRNVSTALDCARLIGIAAQNQTIWEIMRMRECRFFTDRGYHRLVSTNRLLQTGEDGLGGKTGFLRIAGFCMATYVRGQNHRELAASVLGARSSQRRFADMRRILKAATEIAGYETQ